MTSDSPPPPTPRRFPWILTVAALAGFVICAGLGVWQLQRAAWKHQILADIAARQTAPAQPIAPVLARAVKGADVSFTRVSVDCVPGPWVPTLYKASSADGAWIWRPLAVCRLAGAPFETIIVDRGMMGASKGSTLPPTLMLPPPTHLVGVLQPGRAMQSGASGGPAPFILMAEQETPPLAGITPSPQVGQAPDNLQYVGAYAPAWFGLAGVLACVYAAMLWRRLRTP